jgi:1-deoxy-D-xylulose-5-phosphate synthase
MCSTCPKDKIVWDVGHQTYAHKLVTGRRDRFHTLRSMGASPAFPAGRKAPTTPSTPAIPPPAFRPPWALPWQAAQKRDGKVIAVIGDGSLTAGLAYEGLNQAGDLDEDLIVVLNDNGMSIAPNVGALSHLHGPGPFPARPITFRKELERFKEHARLGEDLWIWPGAQRSSFKTFSTPGMLFEAFKFNYIGPVDGHRWTG